MPTFAQKPVGAGFACPKTSTALFVGAFGQADPAPTGNLVKCGHSNLINEKL